MFGHVDVGCLHVRPALNLRDPEDEKLLRVISDEVVALCKRYGGVLWAEHGKGFRSEYSPTFFGPELYEELRAIKAAFDPHNQLNPGKLATPKGSHEKLITIDAQKRGAFDRQISDAGREHYAASVHCNGNGQCFDYDPDHVMCPSSKVTRDRIHSPKGRAGILREWLRLLSSAGYEPSKRPATEPAVISLTTLRRSANDGDFSHEVYDAMNGCLACKACATQCPVKVDIPDMRAQFLELYHSRYRRPLKDYFVAMLEDVLVTMSKLTPLVNAVQRQSWFKSLLERWIGIVDSPQLSKRSLSKLLADAGAPPLDEGALSALSPVEKQRTVLVAQDAFTTFYEAQVALSVYRVLTKFGLRVVFLPFRPNGKGLHIKGFLRRFERVAEANRDYYARIAVLGIPIVGIEPAVTLTYRDEYQHALKANGGVPFKVQLLQEYLSSRLDQLELPKPTRPSEPFTLFTHCTERTAEARSVEQWQRVFKACGIELQVPATGCCGMCGVYGHESEHLAESRGVFEMSWGKRLPKEPQAQGRVLAQGHSCRSQVKRFAGFLPRHPLQALDELLGAPGTAPSLPA
jgi:Fe-S oxidoreductase